MPKHDKLMPQAHLHFTRFDQGGPTCQKNPLHKGARLCEKSATAGRESVNWLRGPHGGW